MKQASKKKICIIALSQLHRDPRVYKQVAALKDTYDVTVIGYGLLDMQGVRCYSIERQKYRTIPKKIMQAFFLIFGQFMPFFYSRYFDYYTKKWSNILKISEKENFDLYYANDINTLPIAIAAAKIKPGSKVIFDAHEYFPHIYTYKLTYKLFLNPSNRWYFKKHKKYINKMITVSDSIASLYSKRYHMKSDVILNVPPYRSIEYHVTNFNCIKLVHHGGGSPGRKLEFLIQLLCLLDKRFELHLYLITTHAKEASRYYKKLVAVAGKLAEKRVFFHSPVPYSDITKELSRFDIGVHILPHVDLNHKLALPNKIFDFIMAGLGVFVGPSIEMSKYINRHDCGWSSASFKLEECANILNNLSKEEIDLKKENSLLAAKELNAEKEMEKIKLCVESTLETESA